MSRHQIAACILVALSALSSGYDSANGKSANDPCGDGPCGDKGVCRDLGNGFAYACQCERGWTDDENYPQPNCKKYDDSTCMDSLCEHGGRCAINDPNNPNCECPPGYSGRWCEHASTSMWVVSSLREKIGVSLPFILVTGGGVVAITLSCIIICCVQCAKNRRDASKSKSSKPFKAYPKESSNNGLEKSSYEEEKSLLSPENQFTPRSAQPVPSPPASRNIGAPALSFQDY